MAELLVEILCEELPAIPILKNLQHIKDSWKNILKDNFLDSTFEFYYTPRRLVLLHSDFKTKQEDKECFIYSPPVRLLFKNGEQTQILKNFLIKNNLVLDDLKEGIDNKNNKKEKVLYALKTISGQKSQDLIFSMIKSWITNLDFGKSMRWGECNERFIRPIRNINILFDGKLILGYMYDLETKNITFVHRQASFDSFVVNSISHYLELLRLNGVILSDLERKNKILNEIRELESKHNFTVQIDQDLLNEIVAITEFPSVLLGSFDSKFLDIPSEILIASMREHQRYFPVFHNHKNTLSNFFVVVSNSFNGNFETIVKGNERVLWARFSDALFFYQNDMKCNFNFGNLKDVIFIEGGGSLIEKIEREKILALELSKYFDNSHHFIELVNKTLSYAKNDLLSQSVGEFSELQGIIGSYFAKSMNFEEEVILAIKEQYLPHGNDFNLPSSKFSKFINLVIKLENIFTLFNLKITPSGSKDPYALRRQAIAVLKMSEDFNLSFDIIKALSAPYKNIDTNILINFFQERIFGIFNHVNSSLVRATLNFDSKISECFAKIESLYEFFLNYDIKSFISTFKRVSNVLDSNFLESKDIFNNDWSTEYEKNLISLLHCYRNKKNNLSYLDRLKSLLSLKNGLDLLFENVLINTSDDALALMRKSLIKMIEREFLEILNVHKITVS